MRNRVISTLLVVLPLITSACGSPMNTPDIKLNPHPIQRYEITVTTDAPGPFDSAKGYATYRVGNVDCVPKDEFEGARNIPNKGYNFALTRVDDKTFKGYFYLDQLLDENYFGLGVCHFDLTGVWAGFEVHGMTFGAIASVNDLSTQRPTVWYTPKKVYFDSSEHSGGWSLPRPDLSTKERSQYFEVTITARRINP